jgi:homoserine kinase type II
VLLVEADEERFILRRYGITPPEEVRWELALLARLHAHGFPTIGPLARARIDYVVHETDVYLAEFLGGPAILYPYIEGHNACRGRVEATPAIEQTAAVVARLHELTAGLSLPHPRVQSGTDSRRLLRELVEDAARRGDSAHGAAMRDMLLRAAQTERDLGERITPHAVRPDDLPRGIVHHDAHCANVLFRDERLVALIDFDDACEGFLLADLAAMVANWAASNNLDALDPDRAMLVVREYERHRPLSTVERELLPDFVAAFMLADAAAYVRERLEQGANDEAAVNESTAYRRFLAHAGNPARVRNLRTMLWMPEW